MFSNCLVFLTQALARKLGTLADEKFGRLGLSTSQGLALIRISRSDSITPGELAGEMQLDPSSITRLVDKLQRLGYVKRQSKGKSTEIRISRSGMDTAEQAKVAWNEIWQNYMAALGPECSQNLKQNLQQAIQCLEKEPS